MLEWRTLLPFITLYRMIAVILLHYVSRVIHKFMRSVEIAGMAADLQPPEGIKISTDCSPIERRVGLACKIGELHR